MKRSMRTSLVFLNALVVAACSGGSPATSAPAASSPSAPPQASAPQSASAGADLTTVEPGVLNIAITGDAPYTGTEGDKLTGIDGDIARTIGERLGLTVKPNLMDFSAGIESTRSGRVDMLIGGVGWSAERSEVMYLTDEIYYVSIAVAQKADNNIKTLEDMNGKIGASITGFSLVPELQAVPGIKEVKLYDTNDAVFQDIVAGRVDFSLMDPFAVELAAKEHPEWGIKQLPIDASAHAAEFPILGNRVVTIMAVNKDEQDLGEAINVELRKMWESCEVRDIMGAYITADPSFFTPVEPDPRKGVDRPDDYESARLGSC